MFGFVTFAFDEFVIATILREVLRALDYLHHHGFIHRDVKLSGKWPDYKNLDCRLRDLLKSEYKIDADINIMRIVLEIYRSKGCYDSHDNSIDKDRFTSISRVVSKTLRKMKGTSSTCRKPIILVLDLEIDSDATLGKHVDTQKPRRIYTACHSL